VRLDKFLKVSRIIKRRTLAQEVCDGGHVKKNGRTAKPSSPVDVGDVLTVTLGSRTIVVRVLEIRETADKKAAGQMFELVTGGLPDGSSEPL
jgi:ribosomal 50S subunit-recycling heat shock protein